MEDVRLSTFRKDLSGWSRRQPWCEAHRLALREGCRHLADWWSALRAFCSLQTSASPRIQGVPGGRSGFHSGLVIAAVLL